MEQEEKPEIPGGLNFGKNLLSKILKPGTIKRIMRCTTGECSEHLIRKWLELQETERFPNYTIIECLEYLDLSQEAIDLLTPHITEVKKVYPTVRRYFFDVWNNLCDNSDEEAAGYDYFECDDIYGIWSIRKYKYQKHDNLEYLLNRYW